MRLTSCGWWRDGLAGARWREQVQCIMWARATEELAAIDQAAPAAAGSRGREHAKLAAASGARLRREARRPRNCRSSRRLRQQSTGRPAASRSPWRLCAAPQPPPAGGATWPAARIMPPGRRAGRRACHKQGSLRRIRRAVTARPCVGAARQGGVRGPGDGQSAESDAARCQDSSNL